MRNAMTTRWITGRDGVTPSLCRRFPVRLRLLVGIVLVSLLTVGQILTAAPSRVSDPSVPLDLKREFDLLCEQYLRNPREASTINALGILYARNGQLSQAIRMWEQGLQIDRGYIHFYNNLGSALKSQRRFQEARQVYQQGLQVAPSYWIHFNLGLLERELGRWNDAAQSFQQCLRLQPGFEPAERKLSEMGLQPSYSLNRPVPLPFPVKPPVMAGTTIGGIRGDTPGVIFDQTARPVPGVPDDPTAMPGEEDVRRYERTEGAPAEPRTRPSSVTPRAPSPPVPPPSPIDLEACIQAIRKNTDEGAPRVVALTFDDGPHAAHTLQLLDYFRAQGVSATFFVLGSRSELYPDLVTRMAKEGHEVGNHTWNHKSLANQSSAKGLADLNRTNDLIATLTGRSTRLVRPPFGHTNSRVEKLIHGQGWHQVMWDSDSRDWAGGSSDSMLRRVLRSFSPGGIVLFHDIHPGAMRVLRILVPALKACGYRFVTISELIGILNAAG